jgi:hypothetical protein
MSDVQQQKGENEVFCPSCGAIIKKEAVICPKCGVEQNNSTAEIKNGFSIASLVLGIVGLLCLGFLIIPGILGFVFSFKGLKSKQRGMAIAGLILNSLQFPGSIIFIISIIEQLQRRNTILQLFR